MIGSANITLLVPVRTQVLVTAIARDPARWVPWTARLPAGERNARDWGRFFAGRAAEHVVPAGGGGRRYTWRVDRVSVPSLRQAESAISVTLDWVDAMVLPEYSILLLDLKINGSMDLCQLQELKRTVGRLNPRFDGDDLPQWEVDGDLSLPIRAWIQVQLLGQGSKGEGTVFGDVDWFGHDAPTVIFALGEESFTEEHCASVLVTSAIPNRAGYRLAPGEQQRLRQSATMHIWDDWQLAVGETAVAFLQSTSPGGCGPLSTNREIYLSMLALVFYQRVRLAEYLERFVGEARLRRRSFRHLCRDFMCFRARFLLPRLSVYPLGERIYQFVQKGVGATELLVRLTAEITLQEGFERVAKDQASTRLIAALAVIAAVFAPVGAIGAMYSVRQEAWNAASPMWWVLVVAIALTLGLIAGILLYNRRAIDREA